MLKAGEIIERFGGVAALCEAVNAVSAERLGRAAVYMWRARGEIPGRWHAPLLAAAKTKDVDLKPEHFIAPATEAA